MIADRAVVVNARFRVDYHVVAESRSWVYDRARHNRDAAPDLRVSRNYRLRVNGADDLKIVIQHFPVKASTGPRVTYSTNADEGVARAPGVQTRELVVSSKHADPGDFRVPQSLIGVQQSDNVVGVRQSQNVNYDPGVPARAETYHPRRRPVYLSVQLNSPFVFPGMWSRSAIAAVLNPPHESA